MVMNKLQQAPNAKRGSTCGGKETIAAAKKSADPACTGLNRSGWGRPSEVAQGFGCVASFSTTVLAAPIRSLRVRMAGLWHIVRARIQLLVTV